MLEQSEERFRSLVQDGADLIVICDAGGTGSYATPSVETVLGLESTDIVGRNISDLVHPEDSGRIRDTFREVRWEPGARASVEFRARHADGRWLRMEANFSNMLRTPGVGGVVINARDITQRRETEEKLRETEARYRALVEQIPAVTILQEIGSPDSALYISPQIETLTGYSLQECRDPDLRYRMVHPEDCEWIQQEDYQPHEPGVPVVTEYRILHKDGRTLWVRNHSLIVEDGTTGARYWQGFMIDITDRKQAEEALREAEERFRSAFENAGIGMALVATDAGYRSTVPCARSWATPKRSC